MTLTHLVLSAQLAVAQWKQKNKTMITDHPVQIAIEFFKESMNAPTVAMTSDPILIKKIKKKILYF